MLFIIMTALSPEGLFFLFELGSIEPCHDGCSGEHVKRVLGRTGGDKCPSLEQPLPRVVMNARALQADTSPGRR